jgi:hypothetical protein
MFGHVFFLSAQRTDCEGIASSPIACLLPTVLARTFSPLLAIFLAVFPCQTFVFFFAALLWKK